MTASDPDSSSASHVDNEPYAQVQHWIPRSVMDASDDPRKYEIVSEVPVAEWEVVAERKHVPGDVQRITGAISTIVRVDSDTSAKQARKHRDTYHLYEQFDQVFAEWQYYRKQHSDESRSGAGERWQFVQLIRENGEPDWPLLTVLELLPDRTLKFITSHRRQTNWGKKWPLLDDIHHRKRQ